MKNGLKLVLALCLAMGAHDAAANENCTDAAVQNRLNNGETPISIYESCDSNVNLLYGKAYAGGLIAYLDTSAGPGYGSGFVAAPKDAPQEQLWVNMSKGYSWSKASATAIGTGKSNTRKIVANLGAPGGIQYPRNSYAAWLSTIPFGQFNDWYLPSRDELAQTITAVIKPSGNCASDGYWSSSEYQPAFRTAYFVSCAGVNTYRMKNNVKAVRLIRSFASLPTLTTTAQTGFAKLELTGTIANIGNYVVKRQGVCISPSTFPTMSNFRAGRPTGPGSNTYIIGFNQATQGASAYARACATVSDGASDTAIYGNQVQFNYPQVIQTLAASDVKAYSATLGGSIVASAASKISQVSVKVYPASDSSQVGGVSMTLNGNVAKGIYASGLKPNTTYKYQATAHERVSNNPQKYMAYPGKTVTFTTAGPTSSPASPKPYMALMTKNEISGYTFPANTRNSCKNQVVNKNPVCEALNYGSNIYLFLSNNNNSWSIVVAKYDRSTGKLLGSKEFWGARYNYGVSVNTTDQTITVEGESNSSITVQWSSLP